MVQKYQNEILDLKKSLEAFQRKAKNEHENTDLKTKYETIQKSLKDTKAQIKTMEQKLISKNSEVRYFNHLAINYFRNIDPLKYE